MVKTGDRPVPPSGADSNCMTLTLIRKILLQSFIEQQIIYEILTSFLHDSNLWNYRPWNEGLQFLVKFQVNDV